MQYTDEQLDKAITKFSCYVMNNTKWYKVFKIVTQYSLFMQMKLVVDYDYNLDHEQSDSVIYELTFKDLIYVRSKIKFRYIFGIRLCKKVFPFDGNTNELIQNVRQELLSIGNIPLVEDDEFITITGYVI